MKRIIYIVAWVFLGFLLSEITHGVIEINFINYGLAHEIFLLNYTTLIHSDCVLPTLTQFLLFGTGTIGGYFAGKHFWQVVYGPKN